MYMFGEVDLITGIGYAWFDDGFKDVIVLLNDGSLA